MGSQWAHVLKRYDKTKGKIVRQMSIKQHQDIHIPIISAPGDTIMETIEIMGTTKDELSKALQLDESEVGALIRGEIAIDKLLAHRLAESLSIPANFWIEREAEYRKDLNQIKK